MKVSNLLLVALVMGWHSPACTAATYETVEGRQPLQKAALMDTAADFFFGSHPAGGGAYGQQPRHLEEEEALEELPPGEIISLPPLMAGDSVTYRLSPPEVRSGLDCFLSMANEGDANTSGAKSANKASVSPLCLV